MMNKDLPKQMAIFRPKINNWSSRKVSKSWRSARMIVFIEIPSGADFTLNYGFKSEKNSQPWQRLTKKLTFTLTYTICP